MEQGFQKKAFRIGLEKLGLIKTRWIQCPVCNNKTHNKIRVNMELKKIAMKTDKKICIGVICSRSLPLGR